MLLIQKLSKFNGQKEIGSSENLFKDELKYDTEMT
jgi:hypothetical protein